MKKFREKTPKRRSGLKQLTKYSSYRKYLKEDFGERCGYCDRAESYSRGDFHIDHFAPQKPFKDLATSYNNLVYSCPICNSAKSNKWISNSPDISVKGDEGFLDPCSDKYEELFYRDSQGRIQAKTNLGNYIKKELKLYLDIHSISWTIERLENIIKEKDFELLDIEGKYEIMAIGHEILRQILAKEIK